MGEGIQFSEKHGLNPSIEQCYFCMEDIGLVLFGKIMKEDPKAPTKICLDRKPCSRCREVMDLGVILISVDEEKTEDPDNPWRTGGWIVVTDAFIKRVFLQEFTEVALEKRAAFISDHLWDQLGLPRGEVKP